jgi:hypothetical protein
MRKCPVCNGAGKQTITFTEVEADEKTGLLIAKKAPSFQIDCVWCKGKGIVTPKEKKVHTYYKTIWCECLEDHGVKFYDDGEHPQLSKHHYRCKKCGKVTQIG